VTLLEGPRPTVPRDRWGRPLIVPDGGGDRQPYRRVTTVADVMDARYSLETYLKRCVAVGLVERPDLLTLIASFGPTIHDREIDGHVADAEAAAKSSERRNLGEALHRFCERVDRGEADVVVPAPFDRDVEAYRRATEGFRWTVIEELVVLDSMHVAGSPDRIGYAPDGRLIVADLKTGKGDDDSGELEWGWPKMAVQVCLYAMADWLYDQATDERVAMPQPDQTVGLIIHLPAGEGRCTLWEVDLVKGREYVDLCLSMLSARSSWKHLRRPWPQDLQQALELSLTSERPSLTLVNGTVDRPTAYAILEARRVPDEGPDADEATVAALADHHRTLPKVGQTWISDLKRSALLVDVNPAALNLADRRSVKRFELARALVGLAERGLIDDEGDQVLRDLLLAIDPALAQPAIPLGAALAALDVTEAMTLARLVDAL